MAGCPAPLFWMWFCSETMPGAGTPWLASQLCGSALLDAVPAPCTAVKTQTRIPPGFFLSRFCNTSRSWERARTHSCAMGAGCRHCFPRSICLASLPPPHGHRPQVPLVSPDPSLDVPGAARHGRQPSRPSGEPALGERVQEVNGGRG